MLQQVPWVPCLDFLAAGEPTHRVFDLLGPGLERVLNNAYREYGLIVIDSAPALQFAEPLKAASLADGVVVIGAYGWPNGTGEGAAYIFGTSQ